MMEGGAMTSSKAQRVVATLPAEVNEQLRALADDRFLGNVSAALAFCVSMGVEVLTGPGMRDRLFREPADALAAYLGSE